jgi:hypothetical protein
MTIFDLPIEQQFDSFDKVVKLRFSVVAKFWATKILILLKSTFKISELHFMHEK